MKKLDIKFDDHFSVPKYRIIIDAIQQQIIEGTLKKGDRIPSLNMLCKEYNLSQDTVLMAYNELKAKGIIVSQVGKGYFVYNDQIDAEHKVLLLFDKLTAYKEDLYESFKEVLHGHGTEQIFFHHNNLKLFKTILESSASEYTHFVLMPMAGKEAADVIATLPSKKVFILDQGRQLYKDQYPFVCQDFERDIYRLLKKHTAELSKYSKLILIARSQRETLREISVGFRDLCKQLSIDFEISADIKSVEISGNPLFIVIDDRDLEYLVKFAYSHNLKLGSELGIISYNETPLKGIVATGITTISTDFAQMGKSMANMIISNERLKLDNPFVINRRSSF